MRSTYVLFKLRRRLYKKGGDLYVKKDRTPSPRDVEPPGIGKEVVTDEGIGKVLKVNYHKHTVKVQLEAGRTIDLKWSDVALPDEYQEQLDDLIIDD